MSWNRNPVSACGYQDVWMTMSDGQTELRSVPFAAAGAELAVLAGPLLQAVSASRAAVARAAEAMTLRRTLIFPGLGMGILRFLGGRGAGRGCGEVRARTRTTCRPRG